MASPPAGRSNQSSAGVAATPTHDQCSIKVIRKCVAAKLSLYWAGVCEYLGYPPGDFKRANEKKSVIAVLEHWISVGEREGRPKTWSMFAAEVLSNNQHPTVSTEICESLRSEGIMIYPPTSRSHDPSPKQAEHYPQGPPTSRSHDPPSKKHYHQPQLVQDDLSSLTDVPDCGITKNGHSAKNGKPSNPRTPTENECDMKTMYKCVVSKLAPYWTTVGDYLEYSVRERNAFKSANDKKSLAAVLENWIGTDNGRQPKTWSTFTRVLMELDQDLSITVGSEICAILEKEAPQKPIRSSSYSEEPPHHFEIEHHRSRTYPTHQPRGGLHQPPRTHDTVKRRLDYNLPKEQSSQPNPGQSVHQTPHGHAASATTHHPPALGPQHSQSSSVKQPEWDYSSQGYQSMNPSHGYQSPAPSQGYHQSMAPSQGYRSTAPSQGYQSMAPSQGYRSTAPSQGYRSTAPSQGYQSLSPSQSYRSTAPSQGYRSPAPSQGYRSTAPSQGYKSMAPSQGYRSTTPSQGYRSMAPSQGYQSMAPSQGYRSPAPSQGYQSMAPSQIYRSTAPSQGFPSLDPSQGFPSRMPSHEYRSMATVQGVQLIDPSKGYLSMNYGYSHSVHQRNIRPFHPKSHQRTPQKQPGQVEKVQSPPPQQEEQQYPPMQSGSATSNATSSNTTSGDNTTTATQSTTQTTNKMSSIKPSVAEDSVDSSILSEKVSVEIEQITSQHQSTPHAAAPSSIASNIPATVSFKWRKGKILGSGAFGRVFACYDEDNNRILAVKEVEVDPNWSKTTKKAVESLEKEITILKTVKHDRIVQYYGTERSGTCVRIFMEFMEGGSLYHYIDNNGSLEENVTSEYTRQLLEGVEYLHISKIIHRDIKGANILMDSHGYNIKIADFGASKLLRSIYLSVRTQDRKDISQRSVAGTAYWMAPEVIRGEKIDHKADIWSVGCTVVEMLTCRPPYGHLESVAAMFKIASEPMCCNLPIKCSSHARNFLSRCFISTASERPAASTLLKHQFIQQIGISNDRDEVTTDGGAVASAEKQPQQATDSGGVDTVTTVESESETGLDTLTPDVTTTVAMEVHSSCSTTLAATSSQVNYVAETSSSAAVVSGAAVANEQSSSSEVISQSKVEITSSIVNGAAVSSDCLSSSEVSSQSVTEAVSSADMYKFIVTGSTIISDQSSQSANNDDDTVDDDADDDDDDNNTITKLKEAAKQPATTKQIPSSMQAEQQPIATDRDVHTSSIVEPQSRTAITTKPTATTASSTTSLTTATDSAGGVAPTNPQLMPVPTESSTTNVTSDYASSATGYASNIDDNTARLKSLPVKNTNHEISNTSNTSSNTCVKDCALWKTKQEEIRNASNAFVSNLFGNFAEDSTAAPVQVVQIFMRESTLTIPPVGPSSLPAIDHSKIAHNSLEPFAQAICCLVDIQIILPSLIAHGLITRFDQEYLINPCYTSVEKQLKLMGLVISLNEKYVKKFLECLSNTADEHPPHGELLEKIRNGEKTS